MSHRCDVCICFIGSLTKAQQSDSTERSEVITDQSEQALERAVSSAKSEGEEEDDSVIDEVLEDAYQKTQESEVEMSDLNSLHYLSNLSTPVFAPHACPSHLPPTRALHPFASHFLPVISTLM